MICDFFSRKRTLEKNNKPKELRHQHYSRTIVTVIIQYIVGLFKIYRWFFLGAPKCELEVSFITP